MVAFTEEILNGKLDFLYSVPDRMNPSRHTTSFQPLSGWTVLTGMMYAIFDIEVIIGNHQCFSFHKQKQSSGGVLRKRCSENMQQIYRKTSMSKCDFNKVAGVPL